MKLYKSFICCSVLFLGTTALFAQAAGTNAGEFAKSEFFVVQIPIERAFMHQKGYVVEYRKTPLINKFLYLPMDWFVASKAQTEPLKGEVILMGTGKSWPYLSVYYKNGKVDHVRLHVRRDPRHFTWGNFSVPSDVDANFENITDLVIEYK